MVTLLAQMVHVHANGTRDLIWFTMYLCIKKNHMKIQDKDRLNVNHTDLGKFEQSVALPFVIQTVK